MTEDYKEKLAQWIMGDYNVTTGSNIPQFSEVTETNNGFLNAIQTAFPDGYTIVKVLQTKDGKGNGTQNVIVVGYDDNLKGFILIMDDNYEILKTFRKYNDNSDIRMFTSVNIDEKGCLYGIEGDDISTNLKLVITNNITAKLPTENDYVLVKRENYSVSGIAIENIKKAPDKDIYTTADTKLSEIKISGNTANVTNYSIGNNVNIIDYVPSWDNQNNFSMSGIGLSYNNMNYYNIASNGTTTLQTTQITGITASYYSSKAIMGDNGEKFIVNADTDTSSYWNYDIYRVVENAATKIDTDACQWTSIYGIFPDCQFLKSEDALYVVIIDYDQANPTKYEFYLKQILGDSVATEYLGETTFDINEFLLTLGNIQCQFNLYDIFFQADNTLFKISEVYNSQNYNGVEYQDYDSLVPNSVNMYDENEVAIFSRNLYNKVINNNTVTSTVVIPNSFLNDIPIYLKELVGKTGTILEDDANEIEKNIYEEVYVNFSNTIKIVNKNNIDNPIINTAGASRLQNSVSNLSDYNNSKMTKFRTTYADNQVFVGTLSDVTQITSTKYEVKFYYWGETSLKPVKIELLSDDEQTIYATLDTELLQIGGSRVIQCKQIVEVL